MIENDEPDSRSKSPDDRRLIELLRDEASRFPDPLPNDDAVHETITAIERRAARQATEGTDRGVSSSDEHRELAAEPVSSSSHSLSWLATLAALFLAAIGIGLWAVYRARNSGPGEILIARAEPKYAVARDGSKAQSIVRNSDSAYQVQRGNDWELSMQSPRDGYATIVLASPSKTEVSPRPGTTVVRVASAQPTRYGPFSITERAFVMVIITESPAHEILQTIVSSTPSPKDAPTLRDHLLGALWAEGYRWAAVTDLTIEPADKE